MTFAERPSETQLARQSRVANSSVASRELECACLCECALTMGLRAACKHVAQADRDAIASLRELSSGQQIEI